MKSKTKLISLLCISAALAACSGSNGVSGNGNPTGVTKPTAQSKSVVISRLPTIPTNGTIGQHYLRVNNNTGETLKLKDFKISKSSTTKLLNRVYDSLNRAVGGSGYDARISMATCETLLKGASCTIAFTPDVSDGSTGVQLNFNANNGEQFSAAQLINYSSRSTLHDGFIVNNDAIQNIDSTVNYSISIPFITDDDYATIDVVSRVITLDKRVDCAKDVKKGAHCTATLTLPVASAAGYANDITLVGKKADGTHKFARISSGSRAIDNASVVMSSTTQVIKADRTDLNKNKLKIIIVNNGTVNALGLTDRHIPGQNWLDGVTSIGNSYLVKNSQCLGTAQAVSGICEVEFELDNLNASGFDKYQITYTNGHNGPGVDTSQSTAIYYTGLTTNGNGGGNTQYGYTVRGSLNFDDTSVGGAVTQTLNIQNTGAEKLHNIKIDSFPIVAGLTASNTCPPALDSSDSCSINITYAPTAAANLSTQDISVVAYQDSTPNNQVSPVRQITLSYSAINNGGAGFVFLNPNPVFSIEVGGAIATQRVMMQNTGDVDYNLRSVSLAAGKPWPVGLVVNSPASLDNGDPNPLAGLALADGINLNMAPITIPARKTASLDYTYGPVGAQVGQSTVTQIFEAEGGSIDSVMSTYEAKPAIVSVAAPQATIQGPNGTVALNDNGDFTLLKTSNFKIMYEYTAGANDVDGFLINDSDLPYGFTVDRDPANTTCKTLSTGDSAGANLAQNTSCKVTYLFVAPNLLNHSLFYTAAANATNQHTIITPGFSYLDANNKRVFVAQSTPFRFTANPFAQISSTLTVVNNASAPVGSKRYKLNVRSSNYDPALIAGNITVKPANITGVNFISTGCSVSSTIGADVCNLDVIIQDTLIGQSLPVNYSTSFDSDYNSINENVSIP